MNAETGGRAKRRVKEGLEALRASIADLQPERVPDSGTQQQPGAVVRLQPP